MSTNTREAQEFLRIFKYVVETGTEVISSFAIRRLLPKYNGDFRQFLADKRHEIFHLRKTKIITCCGCHQTGCILRRTPKMENWIFDKIYDNTGHEDASHIIHRGGKIAQACLHKFVPRTIAINELDIGALSFLLQNLAILSQKEHAALGTIKEIRSNIVNASSTNCYPIAVLNDAWTKLENALVDIADPSYKSVIHREIMDLRNVGLEKEEKQELLKNESIVSIYKIIYLIITKLLQNWVPQKYIGLDIHYNYY